MLTVNTYTVNNEALMFPSNLRENSNIICSLRSKCDRLLKDISPWYLDQEWINLRMALKRGPPEDGAPKS